MYGRETAVIVDACVMLTSGSVAADDGASIAVVNDRNCVNVDVVFAFGIGIVSVVCDVDIDAGVDACCSCCFAVAAVTAAVYWYRVPVLDSRG